MRLIEVSYPPESRDYLWDDTAALIACSLTCHAWHLANQHQTLDSSLTMPLSSYRFLHCALAKAHPGLEITLLRQVAPELFGLVVDTISFKGLLGDVREWISFRRVSETRVIVSTQFPLSGLWFIRAFPINHPVSTRYMGLKLEPPDAEKLPDVTLRLKRIEACLYVFIFADKTCSLTCRDWLPSSRYHLYSALDINSNNQLTKLQILLDHSPHICEFIREIHIAGIDRRCSAWLLALSTRLSRLESLTLKFCLLRSFAADTFKLPLPTLFPALRKLIIRSSSFDRECLPRMLFALPQLSHLELKDVCCMKHPLASLSRPSSSEATDQTVYLETLRWDFVPDDLIEWLLWARWPTRIRTLNLLLNTAIAHGQNTVDRLLEVAGGSLENLSLSLGVTCRYKPLDLSRNPGLASLQLVLYAHAPDPEWFAWVTAALMDIPPIHRSLKHVHISFQLYESIQDHYQIVTQWPWAMLDRALSAVTIRHPNVVLDIDFPGCSRKCIESVVGLRIHLVVTQIFKSDIILGPTRANNFEIFS
ncbi:predicted protein [Postia placenta Mad-698-R]|nr:predicted protein [Postia placenta Mad-698-R]